MILRRYTLRTHKYGEYGSDFFAARVTMPGGNRFTLSICERGLRLLVRLPRKFAAVHITLLTEPPKTGCYVTLQGITTWGSPRIVIPEVDEYDLRNKMADAPLPCDVDCMLLALLKKHNLAQCYALIEWS